MLRVGPSAWNTMSVRREAIACRAAPCAAVPEPHGQAPWDLPNALYVESTFHPPNPTAVIGFDPVAD